MVILRQDKLTMDDLIKLIDKCQQENKYLILKFSATWCGPCQTIKPICHTYYEKMNDNVIVYEIDIDQQLDLYMAFKSKRMLKGVPTLKAWVPSPSGTRDDPWYIADYSMSGSSQTDIDYFFGNIIRLSNIQAQHNS
jgi:thiol-disulfide isomerase/thioredoxin